MFKVSQSKVKTFRRCHRAYYYKYVDKIRPKRIKRPFMFGRIVHEMVETEANAGDPFKVLKKIDLSNKKLFTVEKEMYGEIITDIDYIMTDYFDYWGKKNLTYVRKDGKASEHEFEIELFPDVIWRGKIDGVAKTPNKLRWLMEHKSFTRMPGEDERWRNLQSVTYIRALSILGWKPVDGTCWDYIKSKPPARPGILKDGTLSSKQIDTLPSIVKATIKEHKFKAKDYKRLIQIAEDNRHVWFKRIHTPVSQDVVANVWEDFEVTIRDMVNNGEKVKDRNIDRHCSWCDYEGLCRAALTGGDVDYIREKEYYVSEEDYEEIIKG